jgi:hypothetical protein
MTHLRKMMLEELERRNHAQSTIDCYLRAVAEFSLHFHRPPKAGQLAVAQRDGWRKIAIALKTPQ